MGDSWKIISFATYAYQESFVTISRKRLHLGTYKPPEYEIFSHIMGDQLMEVLVDENEDDIILIGRTDWRGKINAYKIPMNKVRNLNSLGHGTFTGVEKYDSLSDSCCIQEKSDESVLLVVSMDTSKHRGKLCQISLDMIT